MTEIQALLTVITDSLAQLHAEVAAWRAELYGQPATDEIKAVWELEYKQQTKELVEELMKRETSSNSS